MSAWRRIGETWARWRKPTWRGWVIDGVIVVTILAGVAAYQTRRHITSGVSAPDFALQELGTGSTTRLAELRGKPVVLLWWAPWCGVCGQESSAISSLAKSVGDDAHVVSIVADYESLASVRQFVEKNQVDYPVLLGTDALRHAYGVDTYPSVFFIDSSGAVVRSVVGYTTGLGLRARLLLVN